VPVGEDVGFYDDGFTDDSFRRELPTVDLRTDAFDDDTRFAHVARVFRPQPC